MGSREDISKPNMNICIGHLSRKRLLPVQPCFLCFSSSLLASLCPRSYFQGGLPQCRAAHGELCDRSGCSSSHGPHDSELPICSEAVEKNPCLLPFVRVGSVRLARNGFDVWLPFSVGRGIFKGLPYDCGPEMFCSQCRSPAPQAPATGLGLAFS